MPKLYEVFNAKGKSIAVMAQEAAEARAEAIGGTAVRTETEWLTGQVLQRSIDRITNTFGPVLEVAPTPEPIRDSRTTKSSRFETVPNGFGGTTERKRETPARSGNRAPAASKRSRKTLRDMLAEREGNEIAEAIRRAVNFARESNELTQAVVSDAIERLKAVPRNGRANQHDSCRANAGELPRQGRPVITRITEDGFYADDDGQVFKVQESEAGRLYAKKLTPHVCDASCKEKCRKQGTWDYIMGAVSRLRPEHKLDFERAKQFGKLYGYCCVCGRTLRKEESIEAGIGPICAGKFA